MPRASRAFAQALGPAIVLITTDFARVVAPASVEAFYRTVPLTKRGKPDRRTPAGKAWTNYLHRNETHHRNQYMAGVPLGEFSNLEWGAKTPYPNRVRAPDTKRGDDPPPGAVQVP